MAIKYDIVQRNISGSNIYGMAISKDGTKILANVSSYLYLSSDSGATWTKITGYGEYYAVHMAVSNDGQKMYVLKNFNYLTVSTDGGATWSTKTTIDKEADGICCSADGTYVYMAGMGNTGSGGYIYRSSNSGSSFTQVSGGPGLGIYRAIACSSDGSKVVIGKQGSYIWTSADYGANWTQRTSSDTATWYGANISDDGTRIATSRYNSTLLVTVDSGANWTAGSHTKYWRTIRGDVNNQYLIAVGDNTSTGAGETYTSSDYGTTWTLRSALDPIRDVFGQSGGMVIPVVGLTGTMYAVITGQFFKKSTDGGANWSDLSHTSLPTDSMYMKQSYDGKVVYATSFYGWQMFKSIDGGQTYSVLTGAPRKYKLLATNSDGSVVLAYRFNQTTYDGTAKNTVAISSDGGATFSDISTMGIDQDRYYTAVISENNQVMFVSSYTGIWKSTNGGSSWASSTAAIASGYGGVKCCSSDGSIVYYADSDPGYIYTSSNTGSSWTQRTAPGSRNWGPMTCSSNGLIAYAGDSNYASSMYKTTDGGANWSSLAGAGTHAWSGIACSADGNNIVAVYSTFDSGAQTYAHGILASKDGGATWDTLLTDTSLFNAWSMSASRSARMITLQKHDLLMYSGMLSSGNFFPFF